MPAGLPSALLDRRPDILVAEQNLVAANANIGVAKAAYFPRISLTGFLGVQSDALSNLFSGPARIWQFVPQVTQPIFNAGRLRSNVRLATAQQELALIDYQRVIQTAFREVSDSLIQYQKVREIRAQQELLVATLQERSRMSYVRYQGGIDTLLNALDADRDLFDAELRLAQTRRNELLALVQLYRALGGGWQYVNRFSIQGRSYKVIPQIKRAERLTPDQLTNVYIAGAPRAANGSERLVPLSTFASLRNTAEPRELKKFQQLNAVRIQGVIPPPVPLDQALTFLENEARAILPQGFTIDYAGESRQLRTEGSDFLSMFLLSAILIYLVLAAQFESFRDPFIILAGSVPLAISGALLFSFLNLTTLNIYSQVGLITLVGLVSKNGILIVQFANHLQELGKDKLAAIIEAAGTRLRPILMTTAATVMGHFPLVIATGPGAGARNSIGIMLVSGMIIGSIFTLFVVPSIYMLVAKKHVLIPSAVPEQAKDDLQTPPLRPAPRLTGVHEGANA